MALLRGENVCEIGHIGYIKNLEFYVDLKNANLPLWKNVPKKVKIKKQKNGT